MSSNVRILPGTGKRDPSAMLDCMRNADLDAVTILGWDAEGMFVFASSHEDSKEILWDIEQLKRVVIE